MLKRVREDREQKEKKIEKHLHRENRKCERENRKLKEQCRE